MSDDRTDIDRVVDRATPRFAMLLTAQMSAFVAIVYLMLALKR